MNYPYFEMADLLKLNKKTLIISSYAPPTIGGGPQQLYNIFSNFSDESYCLLTSCKNIRPIKDIYAPKLNGKYYYYDEDRTWMHKSKNIFLRIPSKIISVARYIKMGLRIMDKEKIDLILGASGDRGIPFFLTYILSSLSGKPYCLHLLDPYRGNHLPRTWSIFSIYFEPFIFRRAKKIFVSSQGLKQYYLSTYPRIAKKFEIINSCDSPKAVLSNHNIKREGKPQYKIIYAGSIYWAQENSIANLIRTVKRIREPNICLEIYSMRVPESILTLAGNFQKIKFLKAAPQQIPEILSSADILFLPLAWNSSSRLVINTAVPMKLIGMMLSGRPILVHAPPGTYLNEYARQWNFGLVVDKNTTESLERAIKKLLSDPTYSKELANNALRAFYANHDAKKVSGLFAKYINQL